MQDRIVPHLSTPTPRQYEHADAIIVGAGVAGLNAALKLKERGFHDVLILEAATRIGGRVYTTRTADGVVINQGAHWVHPLDGNIADNPVTPDLTAYNIPSVFDDSSQLSIYFSDGVERKSDFRSKMLSSVCRYAVTHYTDKTLSDHPTMNEMEVKLAEVAPKLEFEQVVDRMVHDRAAHIDPADQKRYPLLAKYIRQNWTAAVCPADCSLADVLFDPHNPGGLIVAGGMESYTNAMADEINESPEISTKANAVGRSNIRLGCAAKHLSRMNDGWMVEDQNGHRYIAPVCALSPSIGVLKSGDIAMEPLIKNHVNNAIKDYRMGAMMKMTFPINPSFFTSDKDRVNHRYCVILDDAEPALVITGNAKNPMVTVLCGGENAMKMEQASDNDQKAYCKKILHAVPTLKQAHDAINGGAPITTDWTQNPLTRGAYSTKVVGGKGHDAPCQIEDGLWLCGEAFNRFTGYVDSAMESGEKAGTLMADALDRQKNMARAV